MPQKHRLECRRNTDWNAAEIPNCYSVLNNLFIFVPNFKNLRMKYLARVADKRQDAPML